MGVEKIHKGDVGTVVILLILQPGTDNPEDISDAVVAKTAKVQLSNNAVITHDCTFVTDGTDGKMTFTGDGATFAVAGDASIQGYLESATKKHHTTKYKVTVFDTLS